MAHEIVTISDNAVFSAILTAASASFKIDKDLLLREIDNLKDEQSFRQGSNSDTKLAKLRQSGEDGVCVLKRKLYERELSNRRPSCN